MIDELSPVYDDVQIREWASNIREIKTRELEALIEKKREEIYNLEGEYFEENSDIAKIDENYRVAVVELTFLKMRRNYLKR